MAEKLAEKGSRFGKWTVVQAEKGTHVDAVCDCGSPRRVRKRELFSGRSLSCGCGRRTTEPLAVGERYGRLVIEQKAGKNARGRDQVIVLCDCGRRKVVPENAVRVGATKSCGCLRSDQVAKASRTHGKSSTPLYRRWAAMFTRTRTAAYIGRGITVASEWNDFLVFQDYVEKNLGPRPKLATLDRIDNDRGYEPGNIRWASSTTQNRNRSNNVYLTARGETKLLMEWSEISGVHFKTIQFRLQSGWPEERAVFGAVHPQRKMFQPQKRESAHNRFFTVQGQKRCLAEWSEISGVSVQAIRARLKLGWSEERALLEPARKHVRDRDLEEPT